MQMPALTRCSVGVAAPLQQHNSLFLLRQRPLLGAFRRSLHTKRTAPRQEVTASATAGAAAAISGLPRTYGYLMASVAFTAAVVQWMVFLVAKARKTAGLEYPKLYAEGNNAVSVKFNCTQRAHQNTLENLPIFLVMQILLAQAYPLTASALGAAWATGRIVYALGYSSGDAKKRLPGSAISNLAQIGTLVTLAYTAFKVLTGRPI